MEGNTQHLFSSFHSCQLKKHEVKALCSVCDTLKQIAYICTQLCEFKICQDCLSESSHTTEERKQRGQQGRSPQIDLMNNMPTLSNHYWLVKKQNQNNREQFVDLREIIKLISSQKCQKLKKALIKELGNAFCSFNSQKVQELYQFIQPVSWNKTIPLEEMKVVFQNMKPSSTVMHFERFTLEETNEIQYYLAITSVVWYKSFLLVQPDQFRKKLFILDTKKCTSRTSADKACEELKEKMLENRENYSSEDKALQRKHFLTEILSGNFNEPRIGSYIRVKRINAPIVGYHHAAIYLGEFKVLHFISPEEKLQPSQVIDYLAGTNLPVGKQSLFKFLNGKDYFEEVLFPMRTTFETEQVVKNYVGETKYNLIRYNCQHLASQIVTGIPQSEEAQTKLTATMIITAIAGYLFMSR